MKLGEIVDEKIMLDIIDNITEGGLKHLEVYTPSFVGASHTPMLNYLVDSLSNLEVPLTIDEEKVENIMLKYSEVDNVDGGNKLHESAFSVVSSILKSKSGELIVKGE